MALSIISAIPTAPNTVRVQFSEAVTPDDKLFEPSNYAFATRFGVSVEIYAKSISVVTSTIVDVVLKDAMLTGAGYKLAVQGMSSLATGVKIEDGGGTRETTFVGDGEPLRTFDLKRRLPLWWNKVFGTVFHAIIGALGGENDLVAGADQSELLEVEKAITLDTAAGADLGVIGANLGVSRPSFGSQDDVFRKLIPIFSYRRKAVLKIFYEALTVVLGPQAEAGWDIFVINPNVLVLEVRSTNLGATAGDPDTATYLHADATVESPPSYMGDYLLADASVDGADIDGNVVILFQQTSIGAVVDDLKASGIEIVVDVIE